MISDWSRRRDLDPGLPPDEADSLSRLANELAQGRPLPRPGFRVDLRRRLLALGQTQEHTPPPIRWRVRASCYCASGMFLLALSVAGVLGAGPLAS